MKQIKTPYGTVPTELMDQCRQIRLLALDVDGVFSDGRIYLGNQGEELKAFHTLDGYGIKRLIRLGINVAVITGRQSEIVRQRMSALGVEHIIQGQEDKAEALKNLMQQGAIEPPQVASMGDDMPDLPMFALSAIRFSVPGAHPLVRQQADYISHCSGGHGAVREVCDLILQAHNQLDVIQGSSV